jgi:hypothetical protein
MTRFQKKEELLAAIQSEHRRLESNISDLSLAQLCQPGVIGSWSVKDILAHLTEWEQMFLGWYQTGVSGVVPQTPAPDLTWGQLDILNQRIYEKYKNASWETVWTNFQASYQTFLGRVTNMSQEELFTAGRYAWLGKHCVADGIAPNSCNHYLWAKTAIRKWRSQATASSPSHEQKGK